MKANIKIASILIVLCLCCTGKICAQMHKQSISAHLGITKPLNNGFVEKIGVVNPSLEWSYRVFSAFSVGLSFAYSYSGEKGESNEFVDGDLVSGYREKSLSTMPLLFVLNYFPLGGRNTLFSPYIGAGTGVQYAKLYINGDAINSNKKSNWAESFSAQLGTRIQPVENGKFYFDFRCLWRYGGNHFSFVETKSIQTLGFILGTGVKF